MFEDREPSIFPHPISAWWIPVLLLLGWGPLAISILLYPNNWSVAEGFGMVWGIAVGISSTGCSPQETSPAAFSQSHPVSALEWIHLAPAIPDRNKLS
jgi:hypothetical protein